MGAVAEKRQRPAFPFNMNGPFEGIDVKVGNRRFKYKPNDKQYIAHNCSADEVFYGGAASHVDAAVYTPFGPKRMGDIKPGDTVCNPAGTTAKVLAIYPQGNKPIFRVTCSDGASTRVTGDHLWLVRLSSKSKRRRQRLMTTRQLQEHMQRQRYNVKNYAPQIPMSKPVQFTVTHKYWGTAIPVDPYLLGVLLGDGCVRGYTMNFCSADPEIAQSIRDMGLPLTESARDGNLAKQYSIPDGGVLKAGLVALGVHGSLANNKHIPETYRLAPLNVRWALVQGLMDTDGTVGKDGHCSFCSVSKQLAEDLQWVLRSLGYKATITTKIPHYTGTDGERKEGQLAYIVYIQGRNREKLFRLERKRLRCGKDGSCAKWRRIVSIEPEGEAEAQCIQVDHPNGLYLTDDFIATHNTYGGKSYYLMMHVAMFCLTWGKDANTIIFRRNYKQLEETIIREFRRHLEAAGLGVYRSSNYMFEWKNGATTWFGHMETPDDIQKHQGASFGIVGWDELTHFEEEMYTTMMAWNRCPHNKLIQPQMISASNPGGIGHNWVQRRFIKDRDPMTLYWYDTPPIYLQGKRTPGIRVSQIYIPALANDNKAGMRNDPNYLSRLKMGMSPSRFRALVEADWDFFEGMAFPEWDRDKHVIEGFPIPGDWKLIRCMDWGYSSPFYIGWIAQDPRTRAIYLVDEIYGFTRGMRGATKGAEKSPFEFNQEMDSHEKANIGGGNYPEPRYGIADPSMWATRGGESGVGDLINEDKERFRAGSRSRPVRVQRMHQLLKTNPATGKPGFMVFKNCKHFINVVPQLPTDPKNPDDVDTDAEDHPYDAVGMGLVEFGESPAAVAMTWAQKETIKRFQQQARYV